MMIPRVLLAEDEKSLRDGIKLNLELEGYEVEEAINGNEALQKFENQRFNLVILDVMMPEVNGFEVCEKIRLSDNETPILFLTAKDTGKDKVTGLKLGADDYLTKPFNLEELLLRTKVLVKHSFKGTTEESNLSSFEFGANRVNFSTFSASNASGEEIHLTKKETALLKLLIDRKNQVVSRQQILQYVWGYDVFPSTRTIDNFILSFRKYFEEDAKNPQFFQSIRGVGYKFSI
ncbi:MAG: response regulator transcription factor [Chitinophagales bacterium]|nr:response regulator transcription factor [Bacteroidota bacterium]MCB9257504.1 response regulator transcription factor [Chitinophagales bacterium]